MAPCKIYGMFDTNQNLKYIGHSRQSLNVRKRNHAHAVLNGCPDSPLYRYCRENNQDIRNWTIVCLVSLNLDDQQAERQSEDYFIDLFRQQGAELLNSNRAIYPNIRRRTYNRNWRDQNPGYMASYARERRKRVKAGLLSPRRKYKLSVNAGESWNDFKSLQKAADYLREFHRPVSVTKLWRHLRPDENDNVGALPLNVLFEKVEDDMQQ